MSRNGVGVYNLPSGQPVITGTTISSAVFNLLTTDLANALTTSIATDGQTAMAANLPMGGFKVTGLGAGTVAGDAMRFEQTAASGANTDITSLAAHPVGKMIAQNLSFQTGSLATGTTLIPFDDTIPQSTEGDQYMSLTITPQNVASTLVIDVTWYGASSVANYLFMALFQDATANALKSAMGSGIWQSNAPGSITLHHEMTAGTTAATTFKVRVGAIGAGTTTFNGSVGGRIFGGTMASNITIREILP